MATKRFCDITDCGQEVTDYRQDGFVRIGQLQLKVSIELQTELNELDLCENCFWKAVQSLDKRPIVLTDTVNFSKARKKRDRHAL